MRTLLNPTQIANEGRKIYREKLQSVIEPEHKGKFLVIDINSGDYAIDSDEEFALSSLEARHPEGVFYLLKIGYHASLFMGAQC